MSGIVISSDQMKDVKFDTGIPISHSQMKDVKFVGGSNPKKSGSTKAPSRSWSDVPGDALKNALPSLGRMAENIVSPLLHPIDTTESIMRGAAGGIDLGLKALGVHPSHLYMNPEEYQKDVGTAQNLVHHLAGRYGSEEGLKNTLATDPAGALLDAYALTPVGGALKLLKWLGEARTAEIAGKILQAPGTLVSKGAMGAGKLVGKGVAHTLARATGTSAESVAESVKGNPGFVKQMRGNGDTEEGLVNDTLKRLSDLKMARSTQYENDLKGLGNFPLSTDTMVKHFVDRMKKEKVAPGPTGKLDFSKSSLLHDEGLPKIENAHQLFKGAWQKKNIGLQEAVVLKHQVGNLLDSVKPGTRAQAVLTDLVKGVDKVLSQHPGYRKMNRDYSVQSGRIAQLEKAFSLKPGARKNVQTILTKMQTHGKRHNQFARALLEKADPSGNLAAQMYGLEMKPWFRRGFGSYMIGGEGLLGAHGIGAHSMTLPGVGLGILAASSPRLVGEAGNLLGKTARGVSAVADRSPLPASALLDLLNTEGATSNGQ